MLTEVMRVYNHNIANLPSESLQQLCLVIDSLCKSGFEEFNGSRSLSTNKPRIRLSSRFLVEALHGIYYAMFNRHPGAGKKAVEAAHKRASYELFSDVLLITNAIQNSLVTNPSGQPHEGPMGLAVDLSPTASNMSSLDKEALTNASFRAKKLPDDIEASHEIDDNAPPSYEPPMIVEHSQSRNLKSIMKSPSNPPTITPSSNSPTSPSNPHTTPSNTHNSKSPSNISTIPSSDSISSTNLNGEEVDTSEIHVQVVSSKQKSYKKLNPTNVSGQSIEMDSYNNQEEQPTSPELAAEQRKPLLDGVPNGSTPQSKNVLVNADGNVLLEDLESIGSEELNTHL